jgi:hypothetical protein
MDKRRITGRRRRRGVGHGRGAGSSTRSRRTSPCSAAR